jgi:hypothetical protein
MPSRVHLGVPHPYPLPDLPAAVPCRQRGRRERSASVNLGSTDSSQVPPPHARAGVAAWPVTTPLLFAEPSPSLPNTPPPPLRAHFLLRHLHHSRHRPTHLCIASTSPTPNPPSPTPSTSTSKSTATAFLLRVRVHPSFTFIPTRAELSSTFLICNSLKRQAKEEAGGYA